MKIRGRLTLVVFWLTLTVVSGAAQQRTPMVSKSLLAPGGESPINQNSTDALANELALLRQSLQTLNTRLQAITEELIAPNAKGVEDSKMLKEVSNSLDLLTHAEERAEVLRKQLIELIEKETAYRTRMTQMDEDLRPENIERALSGIGTTRTVEMRDTRRRSLESERKGLESLLALTSQSRARLEEEVRQADSLVARIRQRLFPLIEKELEKISPPN